MTLTNLRLAVGKFCPQMWPQAVHGLASSSVRGSRYIMSSRDDYYVDDCYCIQARKRPQKQ